MANTIITNFTGNMTKFYAAVEDGQISNETQKVTITGSSYTLDDLKAIRTEATNATIVLQAAANPQLEGTADDLIDALADIKYSGAITLSEALTNTNLADVLALTTGKVTADVSGTAADLVEALADEKTVNALTVTVDAGVVDASDLKILDAKTSVTVDASLVTAITGTAAELKTVLAAKTITLDTNTVTVTVDGKVSAADLNTITKATAGAVTAEVEGSAAALNAALKEVSANAITVILTGTTATAKDLKELATKTSKTIDASGIETITGTLADVTAALAAVNKAPDVNVTITGPVTVTEINAIVTTGVIKATLEGSAAELATLTASNSNLLTLKVTGTTATATQLNAIDAATSVKVNASAVTSITDTAANLKAMYASKTISGLGNEAVTITGAHSAKDANVILKATSGIVTASVTDTAADLVKDLTDAKATDKLTLTVSAGTATAAELKALDAKTSVAVDASAVTGIKGTAADVKTVLKADGITLDKVTAGAVAVEVTGTVSAADANTIAKATDGKVTATVAAGTAASLKAALVDAVATDALKLKVTGTATVADLLALHGKTSIPVDAKSVTAITGTAGEFATLNTTNVDLSSTVALTFTGTIAAADVNAANGLNDIAAQTFGKVTATVEGSATALQALTTASTDAITVKVTGTTATAAELIAIDKVTSVVVDAKAVKTITADAADVADVTTVLAAKTIAKAADVAVTISDANTNDITALEANSIAKLATGVVTATVADGSASYLNSTLKDAKATDALKLTVIGTTATAADLNALDAKTKEVIDVKVAKIEGTLADLNKVFVDVVTSTHFDTTSNSIKNVNITDKTVTADAVSKIGVAAGDAVVKATVTADSAANLVEALKDATENALTLTVNGATATAANLDTLNVKTSVDVTVNATEVTGTFNQLKKVYVTDKADFTALGNENIVITDDSAADDIDTIANATTGKVTATLVAATPISDATVMALTHVNGTTDVISFTAAAATTADATALVALAAKVITADATAFEGVTAITEATANIGTNGAAVVSALNIAGNDVTVSFTDAATAISAASADAIADATSGVVTAVVTAGTAAALNAALVDSGAQVNAYTLTVSDTGSVKATDLTGLDGKTSVAVVATSVTDITGSSSEVAAAYAANTAGTISGLGNETVSITGTDATVANVAAINLATTGLVTVSEVDVTGTTFNLADLGDLAQITGLKTIDATNAVKSDLTLKFADLFGANDTAINLPANIAVKLGAGDTLTLDATGWTQTSGTGGNGTYVHANGTSAYTVTVTGADSAVLFA